MKRDYVNLKVQVIEVQLSDCIAGSCQKIGVFEGTTEKMEAGDIEDVSCETY